MKKIPHIRKALPVLIILICIIAALFTRNLNAQGKTFSIDTGKSCVTSECHSDMGKKKYVHSPAGSGESCTGCHDVLKPGEHGFQISLDCSACHGSKAEKEHKHPPVKDGLCTMCHDPHQSDFERQLQAPVPDLCNQCHENKADKKFKHSPVEAGMCLSCHLPHESDSKGLLLMPAVDSLCFMCHDENKFKGSAPHTPVSEGRCLDCHSPHSTDNPKQLVKPLPDICFDCHDRDMKDTKGINLPSTKKVYTGKGMILHKPFAEGRCIDCHYPHPSDNYRRLKGSYPEGSYVSFSEASYSFCLTCHPKLKNALREPRTLTDTGFRNGNLNLHYRHVNRVKGRTCKTCHEHHGSKNPRLVRDAFPFGNRSLTMKYSKTDTGGSCTPGCHAFAQYDRYEPREITMKTTPREGTDASPEELLLNREKEAPEIKKEGDSK